MRLVYIAHPYGGDPSNLQAAREWVRWAFGAGKDVCPIAPWIVTCEILDDANPSDRRRGMETNMETVLKVNQVWLCGPRVSSGMLQEARVAFGKGIPVLDFTGYDAPPDGYPYAKWWQP